MIAQAPELTFHRLGIEDGLANNSVQALLQDREGYLWIGTWDGLSRYDGIEFRNYHHQPFDPNSIMSNDIKAIYEDSNGKLWVGMQRGLSRFFKEEERFYNYYPIPGNGLV